MADETCPVCSKPSEARFAPFCSKRCADIDLGRWLKGSYVIPATDDAEKSRQSEPENDGGKEEGDGPEDTDG
jgi:uncharacterized protein